MLLLSLIVLMILFFWLCFEFIAWAPVIILVLLGILILAFLLTHIFWILGFILICWVFARIGRKKREEKLKKAFEDEGPRSVDEDVDDTQASEKKKPFKKLFLDRVLADFKENQAVNLGDGLWVDQARQRLLFILDESEKDAYLESDFDSIKSYKIKQDSEYSRTFAVHLEKMDEYDYVNVTLSKQENDLLGQSPAAYMTELLQRFGQEK
ncbi:hypothetical protein G6R29_02940 [Fructobacillus sp. M2-14]|uniref:Uncharacterized protein n=1 Tax=Fructobacillus broussonetiae TaxID=2713173 RepID=A0ABS5QZF7_9LACO|nr:hypothetical protein [Fructobacillus broussonetiae]MBS9338590.1 hypothetical protein [Fructobacillus broussonetiae]